MSTPRRKAIPQPWHARSIAAWDKWGQNIKEERKALQRLLAQRDKGYVQSKDNGKH